MFQRITKYLLFCAIIAQNSKYFVQMFVYRLQTSAVSSVSIDRIITKIFPLKAQKQSQNSPLKLVIPCGCCSKWQKSCLESFIFCLGMPSSPLC